jgi:hypothetical protein
MWLRFSRDRINLDSAMANDPHFLRTIDAFMAAEKHLVGAEAPMVWQPGGNAYEMVIKLPIEVGGEFMGANLQVTGYPRERALKYRLGIIFPPAICRLDYVTDETHSNTRAVATDGIPGLVRGPHYHSWPLNRRFVQRINKTSRLCNAEEFNGPRTFDAGLRWFCGETRIILPPRHQIELPTRTLLI